MRVASTASGAFATCAPGWGLRPLHGNLDGYWAITVNGNWGLAFAFDGRDAVLVDYQDYRQDGDMTRMHNPAHPGAVLREYLGGITVTDAAARRRLRRHGRPRHPCGSEGGWGAFVPRFCVPRVAKVRRTPVRSEQRTWQRADIVVLRC